MARKISEAAFEHTLQRYGLRKHAVLADLLHHALPALSHGWHTGMHFVGPTALAAGLGTAIKGHIGSNLLGGAAHHSTNIGEVQAHKGFQHGVLGQQIHPLRRLAMNLTLGPESMADYDVALKAGKKFYEQYPDPSARNLALKGMVGAYNQSGLNQHTPGIGPQAEALKHELYGTTPKLETHAAAPSPGGYFATAADALKRRFGLAEYRDDPTAAANIPSLKAKFMDDLSRGGGTLYGTVADKMSGPGMVQTGFETGPQRVVQGLIGGAPIAALGAEHGGTVLHGAGNAARMAIANSKAGQREMAQQFEAGMQGKELHPVLDKVINVGLSPAAYTTQRAGKALRDAIDAQANRASVAGGQAANRTRMAGEGVKGLAPSEAEARGLANYEQEAGSIGRKDDRAAQVRRRVEDLRKQTVEAVSNAGAELISGNNAPEVRVDHAGYSIDPNRQPVRSYAAPNEIGQLTSKAHQFLSTAPPEELRALEGHVRDIERLSGRPIEQTPPDELAQILQQSAPEMLANPEIRDRLQRSGMFDWLRDATQSRVERSTATRQPVRPAPVPDAWVQYQKEHGFRSPAESYVTPSYGQTGTSLLGAG